MRRVSPPRAEAPRPARGSPIRRAVEETSAGICFKEPKSRSGRRQITVPQIALDALVKHQSTQSALKEAFGSDHQHEGLICSKEDGALWRPSAFTSAYRALLKRRELAGPNFHALRHSHASQLIKNGADMKVLSKRLGHSRTSFTMDVYAHLLPGQDEEAAARFDAALRRAIEASTRQ
jgi:integrase